MYKVALDHTLHLHEDDSVATTPPCCLGVILADLDRAHSLCQPQSYLHTLIHVFLVIVLLGIACCHPVL